MKSEAVINDQNRVLFLKQLLTIKIVSFSEAVINDENRVLFLDLISGAEEQAPGASLHAHEWLQPGILDAGPPHLAGGPGLLGQ